MDTLLLYRNEYTDYKKHKITTKKNKEIFQQDKNINSLLKTSLTGTVHRFDETMSKEIIHKKMDDLFGW